VNGDLNPEQYVEFARLLNTGETTLADAPLEVVLWLGLQAFYVRDVPGGRPDDSGETICTWAEGQGYIERLADGRVKFTPAFREAVARA
jgi:hypothetical protein